MSHSINISILWIEERDSDQKVLLAERIIPTGIMGCYQVTLHIAQDLLSHSLSTRLILWSAGLWTCRILLTFDISILWIEERDSDQKVLLAERIIPTGTIACCQL